MTKQATLSILNRHIRAEAIKVRDARIVHEKYGDYADMHRAHKVALFALLDLRKELRAA